jgi:hypothetical protein
MFWGKGEEAKELGTRNSELVTLIGKVKKDTFNGGYFLDGSEWEL